MMDQYWNFPSSCTNVKNKTEKMDIFCLMNKLLCQVGQEIGYKYYIRILNFKAMMNNWIFLSFNNSKRNSVSYTNYVHKYSMSKSKTI